MAETKQKRGETFESQYRRFSRKLQESGRLLQARKIRFFTPKKSRTKRREEAKKKTKILTQREYLKKVGKLDDQDYKFRR